MRRLLVLVTLVGALFMVVQVQAYKRTAVTAQSSITVTSTDAAALRLLVGTGDGNAAGTAYYASASKEALYLDFRKGLGGAASYGFAPSRTPALPAGSPATPPAATVAGDKYRFRGLFQVRNAKNVSKCVWVYVPGGGVSDLEAIYMRPVGGTGSGTKVADVGGVKMTTPSPGCVTIPANTTYEVDFWWSIVTTTGVAPFNVRVEAQ